MTTSSAMNFGQAVEFKGTYYTSWYSVADRSRGQTQKSYLDKLHKVGCFDSLDSFSLHWEKMILNYFPVASGILTFREDIKPVWEADVNRKGGKFAFACTQGYEDAIHKFLKIVTGMITGGLEPKNGSEKNESICGVIISMRQWGGTITIWNNDSDEEKVADILEKLYALVGRSERILYQKHSKSIAENRKHIFCKRTPVGSKNSNSKDRKRSNRDRRPSTRFEPAEDQKIEVVETKSVKDESGSGKDESGSDEEERINGVSESKQDVVLEVVSISQKEEICNITLGETLVNNNNNDIKVDDDSIKKDNGEGEEIVQNCNIVTVAQNNENIVVSIAQNNENIVHDDAHSKDEDNDSSSGEWSSDETDVSHELIVPTNQVTVDCTPKESDCGIRFNVKTLWLILLCIFLILYLF